MVYGRYINILTMVLNQLKTVGAPPCILYINININGSSIYDIYIYDILICVYQI